MMDRLVQRLSTGKHPVLFECRTNELYEIKERLAQGFVFITFVETQGSTELGINLDNKMTCLRSADLETGKGTFRVAGTCELNFQKVRCIADIDLTTQQGLGYLELLDE